MSITLSPLKLVDNDIRNLQNSFKNLHTLSVAFNYIKDAGLIILMKKAPNVTTLDLEANEMVFDSQAADMLWSTERALRHLNVSHNSQTNESIANQFIEAGRSNILTLDAAMARYGTTQVPARLLRYLLRNEALERADLRSSSSVRST